VEAALEAVKQAGDVGAQIRFLTVFGNGLIETKAYAPAMPFLDSALQLATTVPDAGYQFPAQEARAGGLIGLKRFDEAQRVAEDILSHASAERRSIHEAFAWQLLASIARARSDDDGTIAALERAAAVSESSGFARILARVLA
jgi:hypothetical protein